MPAAVRICYIPGRRRAAEGPFSESRELARHAATPGGETEQARTDESERSRLRHREDERVGDTIGLDIVEFDRVRPATGDAEDVGVGAAILHHLGNAID